MTDPTCKIFLFGWTYYMNLFFLTGCFFTNQELVLLSSLQRNSHYQAIANINHEKQTVCQKQLFEFKIEYLYAVLHMLFFSDTVYEK